MQTSFKEEDTNFQIFHERLAKPFEEKIPLPYVGQMEEYLLKVLLIGDSGVGKSSLMLRFTDDRFTEHFASTIGVDFRVHSLRVGDKKVRLQLWDTAGQERFRTITKSYFRGAQAVLLVFDLSNRDSFAHLGRWLEDLQHYCDGAEIVLVGNKSDLQREVDTAEAEAWAAQHNCTYVECSCKENTAKELNAMFKRLAYIAVRSKSVEESKVTLTEEKPTRNCC